MCVGVGEGGLTGDEGEDEMMIAFVMSVPGHGKIAFWTSDVGTVLNASVQLWQLSS